MREDLVNVFSSESLIEAQMLSDVLSSNSIKNFLENVNSPLDGLTAGDQEVHIFVLPEDADRASEITHNYMLDLQS